MALAKRPGRRQREAGQAVIMVNLGITFLLGLLGLVVDVGYGHYVKQAAQGAADAAVMAAITAVGTNPSCGGSVQCQTGYSCPSNASNATDFGVACLYAQSNGFTNGNGQTVTLSVWNRRSANSAEESTRSTGSRRPSLSNLPLDF